MKAVNELIDGVVAIMGTLTNEEQIRMSRIVENEFLAMCSGHPGEPTRLEETIAKLRALPREGQSFMIGWIKAGLEEDEAQGHFAYVPAKKRRPRRRTPRASAQPLAKVIQLFPLSKR